ncbi:flocculation protein FLO11-like [Aplysia californica]|uniref:Flocculation protein FLO11-like n=1 Tax=Aplysia californica TaxID=6500 RepID=A0ABM0ZYN4_APLCA|nr:flocculation protein FLO11-like [Aplysia californica]XP_035825353.1 flocculation protein FLO11-like [Aplysia californica]
MNQDLCEESTTHVQKLVSGQTKDDSETERSTFVGGHDLNRGLGSGGSLTGSEETAMACGKTTPNSSSCAVLDQDVGKCAKKGEKTSIFGDVSNVLSVANLTPAWFAQSGLLSLVQTEYTSSSSELLSSAKSSLLVETSSSFDRSSVVETSSSPEPSPSVERSSSVDPSSFSETLSTKKEDEGNQASISLYSGLRRLSLKMSSVASSSSSMLPVPPPENNKTDKLNSITEHERESASAGESKLSDKTSPCSLVSAASSARPSSQQSVPRMTPRPCNVFVCSRINPEVRQKQDQGSSASGVAEGAAGQTRPQRPRIVFSSLVNISLRLAEISAASIVKNVDRRVSKRPSSPSSCSNAALFLKTSTPPPLHPDSNDTDFSCVGRQEQFTQIQDRQAFAQLPIVTVSRMPPMPKFWEYKPLEFNEVIVVHAESPSSFVVRKLFYVLIHSLMMYRII